MTMAPHFNLYMLKPNQHSWGNDIPEVILGLRAANNRWRYFVTTSIIGLVQA